ncbi:unnamed protein product [Linum trigynum]|uniref:RNA helicase n=1 Tax=Linum trigynum TaxID=586398 RepID=A0AAV2F5I0_9ROSI
MFADQASGSIFNRWNGKPYSQKFQDILDKRNILSVWKHKEEILDALKKNQVLVLVDETGSGKTTQIPQFVLEMMMMMMMETTPSDDMRRKKVMVGCTQPRRVAEISVS